MSDQPTDRALERIAANTRLQASITEFEAACWSSTPQDLNDAAEKARARLENLLDAIAQQIAIAKRDAGLDASGKLRGT